MTPKKKLIEVALPLEAINIASGREKSIRHGHPSTFHLWWARRPLAAARAVIFAQMVDDPSAHPDIFPTEKKQEKERQRLFRIIEDLVKWENTTNETVLQQARDEIWQSWRYTCAENADHPRAKELFDRYRLPAFHDPFAGGGALPLEAQRLGLESYASDLNPVAVLINKAMIEIPPKFAGLAPVNPGDRFLGIGDRDGPHSIASGFERLAEGDGSGIGSVPVGENTSEDGGVSAHGSIAESCCVGPGEHRGGTRAGNAERLRALRECGEGIAGGDRDVLAAGGENGPAPGRPGGQSTVFDERTRQDADRSAATTDGAGNSGQGVGDRVQGIGNRATPKTHSLFPRTWHGPKASLPTCATTASGCVTRPRSASVTCIRRLRGIGIRGQARSTATQPTPLSPTTWNLSP